MPIIDRREIIFDEASLIDILGSFQAANNLSLPEFAPSDIEFDAANSGLTVRYGKWGRNVPLRLEALGALLISYCIQSRFPIPRNAAKSVRVTDKAIILSFQSTFAASARTRVPRSRTVAVA